jgi:hypothetical protein
MDFNDKNEEDGKPLSRKTFRYLDGFKFDCDTVMNGLDDEIVAGKRVLNKIYEEGDGRDGNNIPGKDTKFSRTCQPL